MKKNEMKCKQIELTVPNWQISAAHTDRYRMHYNILLQNSLTVLAAVGTIHVNSQPTYAYSVYKLGPSALLQIIQHRDRHF